MYKRLSKLIFIVCIATMATGCRLDAMQETVQQEVICRKIKECVPARLALQLIAHCYEEWRDISWMQRPTLVVIIKFIAKKRLADLSSDHDTYVGLIELLDFFIGNPDTQPRIRTARIGACHLRVADAQALNLTLKAPPAEVLQGAAVMELYSRKSQHRTVKPYFEDTIGNCELPSPPHLKLLKTIRKLEERDFVHLIRRGLKTTTTFERSDTEIYTHSPMMELLKTIRLLSSNGNIKALKRLFCLFQRTTQGLIFGGWRPPEPMVHNRYKFNGTTQKPTDTMTALKWSLCLALPKNYVLYLEYLEELWESLKERNTKDDFYDYVIADQVYQRDMLERIAFIFVDTNSISQFLQAIDLPGCIRFADGTKLPRPPSDVDDQK